VIPAIVGYLVAFGMAWAQVLTRAFPWTLLLLAFPALWIAGVLRGFRTAAGAGFYGLIGVAVWAALSGNFYLGLAAVAISIVAWDAADLSAWLRKADQIRDEIGIWQALLLRSSALAATGAALALVFAQLELSLPFWVLVLLLLAVWAALAAFRWGVAHPGRSHSHDGGDRGTR
jgi:hypothetical protein